VARKKKHPFLAQLKEKSAVRARKRAQREARAASKAARRDADLALLISKESMRAMRQAMLKNGWAQNSCIDSARMLCDLAKRMNLDAMALTVEATAYNAALWDWMRETDWAEDDSLRDDVVMDSQAPPGSRLVVLGKRDVPPMDENSWPGHLVVVLGVGGEWKWVVDLTLDQAQRKDHELPLEPLSFRVDQDWLDGSRISQIRRKAKLDRGTRDGEIAIEYRAFPHDESYMNSPAWKREYGATISQIGNTLKFSMNRKPE